ncbi:hypothetical protein PMAYCL1PPCAC_05081 [Pristionchus mayeri]|uniref:Hyaluronidase n=1 Tax=Pristionchus mayeri TaxID=1317129 RepID=A0AAN4Z9G5_9BILA|nr:hypothetical protein PMAYCL1PPCAC_05081 [Pristionchus mayeri]
MRALLLLQLPQLLPGCRLRPLDRSRLRPFLLLLALGCCTTTRAQTTTTGWSDRFTAFWNVPSERCHGRYDVAMPLREYHIVHNAGFRFRGDQVVLFYEYQSGLFPYFEGYNASRPVNGGLPQKVDISAHLSILEDQILTHIPDENFNGPAVLDVEEWRPMYHLNWGRKSVYKLESVRLVRDRYPSISEKSARIVAEEEFNRAAKKLLTLSLQLARRLRPNAKWSMYGFPYCNYDAGARGELRCSANYAKHNDRLRWLTAEFTALSPSIYLDASANNTAANYRYIYAVLSEARRIAEESSPPPPVIPYTKFEYNPYEHEVEKHIYYSKRDLCNSLKLSSDLGAAGVLVWSTDRTMTRERCHTIRANVAHSFGPAADLVRRRANRCALEQCSGNGRCILKRPAEMCTFRMPQEDYECACDASYYGAACERMHHLVDAETSTAQDSGSGSGSGSGTGTTEEPEGSSVAFVQAKGDYEEQDEDPLAGKEAALHAGVVPPVPALAPSLWANRIDTSTVPLPTAAPNRDATGDASPSPLPTPPTHFNINDNAQDAPPGIELFTRIL